jgi:IS5 family transposase
MKAMVKRRGAIEPLVGHMKSDFRFNRNPLKSELGDVLPALLCGTGFNIPVLLSMRRLFLPVAGYCPSQ